MTKIVNIYRSAIDFVLGMLNPCPTFDPMDFNILKAQEKDMSAVLELIQELATFEKQPDAVLISEEELKIAGFGDYPSFECYLAFAKASPNQEPQVMGMAFLYKRFSTWKGTTLHLEDLIVKQEMRGKGIGLALYKRFLERAQELQVRRAEWVVLDWNVGAIDFYKASGATVFEDWNTVQISDKLIAQFLKK